MIDTSDTTGLVPGTTVEMHRLLDLIDRAESSINLLIEKMGGLDKLTPDIRGHVMDDLEAIHTILTSSGFNQKHYNMAADEVQPLKTIDREAEARQNLTLNLVTAGQTNNLSLRMALMEIVTNAIDAGFKLGVQSVRDYNLVVTTSAPETWARVEEKGLPRRFRSDLFTPEEKAIADAAAAVERMAAHPKLTEAVTLLNAARSAVADFIESHPSKLA